MKLVLLAGILWITGCKAQVSPTATKIDTVKVFTVLRDSSQQKTIDSLRAALLISNYKVERVRYYLKICLRNPSQDKFLKGWVKRAIQ